MKILKIKIISGLVLISLFTAVSTVKAQFVISEVIKLTVTKIIKAIDLKVQRMQNKTIWLRKYSKGN